jgi:hypothetical protein
MEKEGEGGFFPQITPYFLLPACPVAETASFSFFFLCGGE